MTFNEYQQWVITKMAPHSSKELALAVWALGLSGKAGETADLMKKFLGHGHSFDRDKLVKELGDVQYYIAALAYECGISLEEVINTNVDKLNKRYPNGFSTENSINRKE